MKFKHIIGFLLITLFAIFIFQNLEAGPIRFLFWMFEASPGLNTFVALCAGIILGMMMAMRKKKELKTDNVKENQGTASRECPPDSPKQ